MRNDDDDYTPVNVTVKVMTKKAALCITENDDEVWVPFSQIHEDDLAEIDVGVIQEIQIKTWFVRKEF